MSEMKGLGIIDDIWWVFLNDEEKIHAKNGFYLLPEKLKIKYYDDDIDVLLGEFKINVFGVSYTFSEYSNMKVEEYMDDFNIFRKVLLALRLLKSGKIALAVLYGIDEDGIFTNREIKPEEYGYYGLYEFNIREIPRLKKIFNIVNNFKFNENRNIKIAVDWLNKTYYSNYHEETLINLCVSLESLFCKGEKYNPKGGVIGLACSMLIGNDNKERSKIMNDIIQIFDLRNKVIHGQKYDIKKIKNINETIENYLRESILTLIK